MRKVLFIILIFTVVGLFFSATAQELNRPKSAKKEAITDVRDTTPQPERKSTAWTLSVPLGEHEKSTVDTLQYNYQRAYIPSFASDAYATTGTLGAEGINMIFFDRQSLPTFFFERSLNATLPSLKKFKFYNVYTPMTLLSYNYGGNKQNHADRLQATFAGNVNRNIGIGAFLDYNYSKGAYTRQATKGLYFGFSFYYNSHRYEGQAQYYHYNNLNQENGGISDIRYITDPAEVQGGVESVEPKSIPVNLSAAHNRLIGNRLFTTHAFKVGYWSEEQVNDTLTRDVYIPLMKFIYSLDYEGNHHNFSNSNLTQGREFWENTYLTADGTHDDTRYWSVTNTIGVELLEGFKKWAKFGIAAYASLQTRGITQANYYTPIPVTPTDPAVPGNGDDEEGDNGTEDPTTPEFTPLPEGFACPDKIKQNRLSVGGSVSKREGELITYNASAKFGLTGGIAGDIDINGTVGSRFRLFGDMVDISAYGGFSNLSNSYFLSHFVSNHFAWDQTIGKTRTVKIGGKLVIPWTRTTLSAGVRNMQNYVYFNDESIPTQFGGNVQVFSATLDQKLKFGIWNWYNTITYQVSSDKNVIPLPALSIYSNMFIEFRAFHVLNLQIGVDCNYYTRYYGLAYQPALMTFHTQHEQEVGNYAFCNAYLSAKLYKCRFYVLWSHVNQGWFSKDYFSVPNYPLNPRCLQLGLCVDFAN
ncbi:MAG: putative porin [Muribaculaceae bacterium]|nr:putative porin [Muribaculaceae bacterium]